MKTTKKIIPIFFASNGRYAPYLDVAITSLLENASKDYLYEINILNTGINNHLQEKIARHNSSYAKITFVDVDASLEPIKERLRDVHYFTLAAYYRLFIEKLFPQYDKALYLDCDIIVCSDISKLYETNLKNNLLAAVNEQNCRRNDLFTQYIDTVVGIDQYKYFNSGVLVLNLKEIRKFKLFDKFVDMLCKYNFDTVMPDQDYLNILCKDRVLLLQNGWNFEAVSDDLQGSLHIRHYALGMKPWDFKDMEDGNIWWEYAQKTPFYNEFVKEADTSEEKLKLLEESMKKISLHALSIINSEKTFKRMLG